MPPMMEPAMMPAREKQQVLEEIGGSVFFFKGLLCTFPWFDDRPVG